MHKFYNNHCLLTSQDKLSNHVNRQIHLLKYYEFRMMISSNPKHSALYTLADKTETSLGIVEYGKAGEKWETRVNGR